MTLLLLTSAALAAQLSLDVGTRELTVGETIPVELKLVDGTTSGLPDLPAGEGLSLSFEGQSQSRVVVNFRSTRIVSYTYAVTALTEGRWSIGPVSLEVDGQTLTAPAVQLVVSPRSEAARAERDVNATLSDAEPVLGQVVVYRFRFRHKGDVIDARWTPPGFDGFVRESTAEMAQRETRVAVDGQTYTVQEIDVPLVAAGAGQRTIGPALLEAKVPAKQGARSRRGLDPFADSPFRAFTDLSAETLTASAIPVTIRPLPEQGRPADFSGLVGGFSLDVSPSATSLRLGESVTLDVVLRGDGTLTGFRLPPPAKDAGYRAYDDEPELKGEVSDGAFVATARFRRAIVPEREGRLEIPPLRVPYFDPEQGAYAVLEGPAITLDVLPGESDAGQVTSFAGAERAQKAVASVGEDINPVPGDATIRDRSVAGGLWPYLVPPALPALGIVALELASALSRRRADPREALLRRLGSLPTDPTARLAAIDALFREAAGLRLGRPAAGLDRASVSRLGEDAAALYADLEAARYGGQAVSDLEARVRTFVERRP